MRETFWVNPAYTAALGKAGMLAQADFMSKGEVVRTVGNKQNVRVHVPGHPTIFLKRFSPDRAGLGPREMENTNLVAALGIPVPETVAAGASALGSFFASTEIPGGQPLDDWLRTAAARPGGLCRRERNAMILQLAGITRRLHSAGYCHRDLYLCHFFVFPGDETRLVLIDLQRVRRASPFRVRWIVKDIAALSYSADPSFCSTADRFRFLKCYLEAGGLDRRVRKFASRVARKSARIARHEASRKAAAPGGESAR